MHQFETPNHGLSEQYEDKGRVYYKGNPHQPFGVKKYPDELTKIQKEPRRRMAAGLKYISGKLYKQVVPRLKNSLY